MTNHKNDLFVADQHIIDLLIKEMETRNGIFGGFNSTHEFYGALLQETDKLWTGIKVNNLSLVDLINVTVTCLRALHQYKTGRHDFI